MTKARIKRPKPGQRIKLGICIPSNGTIQAQTSRCIAAAAMHFTIWAMRPPEWIDNVELALMTLQMSCLPQCRHDLVKKALQENCTHVLFIDSDMFFPEDTFQRMLLRDKDVLGINATLRRFPVHHIAHDMNWHEVDSRKKYGVQKVQHVGTGIMMIKAEVFKKMQPPLFMFEWVPDLKKYSGEDVYFCAKCDDAGVEIHIDHDLSHEVGHIGSLIFGPGFIGHELPNWKIEAK